MGLVLAIMLIIPTMIISVSATSYPYNRYALQDYRGSSVADTYSLRASNLGGLYYYAPEYSKCTYGAGTDWGVYPEIFSSGTGFWYGGLIFPATNSLKLIGANCSEIDSIATSGSLKATMGHIDEYLSGGVWETPKYVLLMQRSNGTWAIDYYSINNETSLLYLYHSRNLGFSLTAGDIKGLACGCPTRNSCAFTDTACFFSDASTDKVHKVRNSDYNILNYSIGNNLASDVSIPFGALVDVDNDVANEFVVSSIQGSGSNQLDIQWVVAGFNGTIEYWGTGSHTFGAGGTVLYTATTPQQLYSFVCQVGGVISDMEICTNVAMLQAGTRENVYVIWEALTGTKKFSSSYTGFYPVTMNIADVNNDGLKDFCYLEVGGNKEYTCKSGSDYSTILYHYNLSYNPYSAGNYIQTFMGGADTNETTQEIFFGSGEVLDIATGIFQKDFDTGLGNTSEGYITMSNLNDDSVDELVYVDSTVTYIYSTNHDELELMNISVTTTTTTTVTGSTSTTTTTLGGGTTTTTFFSGVPILNTGGDLVNTDNPADAIDTSDDSLATGLLPEVYFGVVEFFKRSFVPIFVILVFVMFLMLALLIVNKVQGGR
jgi:hypothetical protein